MQASIITLQAARSYGRASIRLACAMALDLSTLTDTRGFDFQPYNELLAETSGLALGSVRNTMTAAKKLESKYHQVFKNLTDTTGLSELSLTAAVQHVIKCLKDNRFGESLPELLAFVNDQASPMLKAQAQRAEAARIVNEARIKGLTQDAQAPSLDAQQQATEQAALADEENTIIATFPMADIDAPSQIVNETPAQDTSSQIVSETPTGFDWVPVEGLEHIKCSIHDQCTVAELYALAETLMQMAQTAETRELLDMAA
jgi:hypothetical protein